MEKYSSLIGIYIILSQLEEAKDIIVGSGRKFTLRKGYYGYIGSALGGLEKRIERHLNLRSDKKSHWHIDYLLNSARVKMVIGAETGQEEECLVARLLYQRLPPVAGFGSSDCRCVSHLFFARAQEVLKRHSFNVLERRNLKPFIFNPNSDKTNLDNGNHCEEH